jgi:hypothetical protein
MDSATPESTAPHHSGWAATMFVCKTTRVTTSGYDPTGARRLGRACIDRYHSYGGAKRGLSKRSP